MIFKFLKKSPKEIFKNNSWEGGLEESPVQQVLTARGKPQDIKDVNLSFNCYTGAMLTLIKNCKSCMEEHTDEELCNLFYQTKKRQRITRKEKQLIAQLMTSHEREVDFEAVAELSGILSKRQLYRILCDATLIFKAAKFDPQKSAYATCNQLLKAVATGEIDGYVDAISHTLSSGVSENLIAPNGWSTDTIPKRRSFFSRVKSGHTCEALVPNCLGNAVLDLAITGDAIAMEKTEFVRFTREFDVSCDGFVLTGDFVHLTGDAAVAVCDHEKDICKFDMLPDTVYVGLEQVPDQVRPGFTQKLSPLTVQEMEEIDATKITQVLGLGC